MTLARATTPLRRPTLSPARWPGSASTCPLPTDGQRPRVWAIVGPTAVGKTRLALALAEHLPVEIVSADSRTVYRGMDVATAKPSAADRARVPHHLLDVVDPDEPYSLAQYQAQALETVTEIVSRGKTPLLVGGAGLYVSAVCDGLALPNVPPDRAFREALESRARQAGWQALQADLAIVDPVSAARIDARNVRRVIRALEVFHATGRPFSAWQTPLDPPPVDAIRIGLELTRTELFRRIDARIDAWLEQGLLVEVRGLLARGYAPELPSMSGLGYRQIAAYLNGQNSLQAAIADIKQATHQYAKRQMTWFRRDQAIRWFDAATVRVTDVLSLFR